MFGHSVQSMGSRKWQKKYEYFSQNLQRMPARGTVSRLQKLASSSICSSILERSWCFTLSVFFFFFFIVFVFSCVSICSSSSSFWTRAAYSCVEPPHKTNSKTHKKIRQFYIVITMGKSVKNEIWSRILTGGPVDKRSTCLNWILQDLFRDTPLDHI